MKNLLILCILASALSLHASEISVAEEYPEFSSGTNTISEWFRRASAAPKNSMRDVNESVLMLGTTKVIAVQTHNYPNLRASTLYVYSSMGSGAILQFRALARLSSGHIVSVQVSKSGEEIQVVDLNGTVILTLNKEVLFNRNESSQQPLSPSSKDKKIP